MVDDLLSDIQKATPRTSNYWVASTRQVSNTNATVYAIAQCAKNVSQDICESCLDTAHDNLQLNCLPSIEGSSTDFYCFMRYSETAFFQSNLTTNITPFLSESEGESSYFPTAS